MHYRITLYLTPSDGKKRPTKVRGAVFVEGTLEDAVDAAHKGVSKMPDDRQDNIARIIIDRDVAPPQGSDPFAAVAGTDDSDADDATGTARKGK